MRSMTAAIAVTAIGLGLIVELVVRDFVADPVAANYLTLGLACLVSAAVIGGVLARRHVDGGLMLMWVAAVGALGTWRFSVHDVPAALGQLTYLATILVPIHLVLPARRWLLTAHALALLLATGAVLAASEGLPGWTVAGRDGRRSDNPLAVVDAPGPARVVLAAWAALVVVAIGVALATVVRRWRSAPPAARRLDRPVVLVACGWGLSTVAALVGLPWAGRTGAVGAAADFGRGALPLLAAAGFTAALGWTGLVRPRLSRSRDGTMVLPEAEDLRSWLADVVGDPTIDVAFSTPDGWVDSRGRTVELHEDRERRVTRLTRDGAEIAALVHHDAVAPEVLELGARLAVAAIDAERASALARGRAEQARAAAARLVQAGDAAARAVSHDLDGGPLPALVEVRRRVEADSAALADAAGRLKEITAQVREMSHGLYPPELESSGLAAVLGHRAPTRRFAPAIEVTAYLAAASDPALVIEDDGDTLVLRGQRVPPQIVLDRVTALGGTIAGDIATVPLEPATAP